MEKITKTHKQINEWLNELLYRDNTINTHFIFKKEAFERQSVRFYTKNNSYCIAFGSTSLGCTVSSRKPRAGEDWTRGNDLPDGKFNEDTWNRIKNAIISYELVKIAKKEISVSERRGKRPPKETVMRP